jgi:hypothetical protein
MDLATGLGNLLLTGKPKADACAQDREPFLLAGCQCPPTTAPTSGMKKCRALRTKVSSNGFGNGVIFLPSATARANPTSMLALSKIKPKINITGWHSPRYRFGGSNSTNNSDKTQRPPCSQKFVMAGKFAQPVLNVFFRSSYL